MWLSQVKTVDLHFQGLTTHWYHAQVYLPDTYSGQGV
jgi:hypothetical protein